MFTKTLLAAMALAGAQAINISSQSQTELQSYANDEVLDFDVNIDQSVAEAFMDALQECGYDPNLYY